MDYPKSVPGVGLVDGKFIDENTTTGQVGSLIPCAWGNAVTDELLNVIRAGGDEPVEGEHDQLVAAIRAIVLDTIPEEEIRTTLAAYGITDAYTKAVTYTKTEIEDLLKNLSALPVGAMVPFPKGTVPAGFLEVNGGVLSIAMFPDLAAYLGTTYNIGGEGAGNFRLPDSRGEFFRGWDHGRGVDAGRGIGSTQADQMQRITGTLDPINSGTAFFNGTGALKKIGGNVQSHTSSGGGSSPGGLEFDSANSPGARTGAETRSRNLAVMWCIKAWNEPVNQGNIDIAALSAEVQALSSLAVSVHAGLVVSATGTNALIAIKARRLTVGNGVAAQPLSNVDVGINLATVGLGGLDAGVVAASSGYSTWVATDGAQTAGIAALMPAISCTTTAGSAVVTGIASTASMRAGMQFGGPNFPPGAFIKSVDSPSQITASVPALAAGVGVSLRFVYEPVLPAGYVAKRVNAFFTDATANKFPLAFIQEGVRVQYAALRDVATGVLSQWSAIAVGAFVPPTARVIIGRIVNANAICSVAPNASYDGFGVSHVYLPSGNGTAAQQFNMLLESSNIYGYSTASGSKVSVLGWEDDL